MVDTRLVTQASMDKVNNATTIEELDGISWVTTLLERFRTVDYKRHSDILVSEKINTLQDLENKYNDLASDANRDKVLQKIIDGRPDDGYARSQFTTAALATALTEVEGDQTAALNAVNTASEADNYAAVKTALETNAETLGLDLAIYNQVNPEGRRNAIANDIYQNKPDGGYDLETLQLTFAEIVGTRMVFQDSVAEFTAATTESPLTDLKYITMLITNLNATKHHNMHSGRNIKDDILPELNKLVTDFNALPEHRQTEVFQTIDYSNNASSTQTRNALRTAIDTVAAKISKDTSITGITVKETAATKDETEQLTYNVELPAETVLANLTATDIVVTAKDTNATVAEATTVDEGKTWTVVVTAEDGTTATYTINVTVAEPTEEL